MSTDLGPELSLQGTHNTMANKTDNTEAKGADLEVVDKSKGTPDETQPVIEKKDNGTTTFENSSVEKLTEDLQVAGAASMDNVSDFVGEKVDYVETPVVMRERRVINESNIDWDAYLENLKKTNPKKYEAKKAERAARDEKEKAAKKA